MTKTIERRIEQALFDATAAAGVAVHLRVQYPNSDLVPPIGSDESYLNAMHFVNTNRNPNWSDETIYQGILQIDYVTPDHKGTYDPVEICGQIVVLFDKGTIIWNSDAPNPDIAIKIDVKPSRLTMVQDGSKSTYPVSISYVCRP